MNIRILFIGAFVFCLCNCFGSALFAQTLVTETEQSETLRGIKGVKVRVNISSGIKEAGLTESMLQTDVELSLRKAGIKVLTSDEWRDLPSKSGSPFLYINVNGKKLQTDQIFYTTWITVVQNVILYRKSSMLIPAATWTAGNFGLSYDLRAIREQVGDTVDKFMNDYLAVNSK